MNNINIKEVNKTFDMDLCKVNRQVIGSIPDDYLQSVNRSIDNIDTLEFKVPKFITNNYTFEKIRNPIYNDIKDERLVLLNEKEYFVIKESKKTSADETKTLKAYSLEYKLSKIDINVEDIGFYLIESDEELEILSLSDYMYQETGWKLGHIDDSVRYDIAEDGTKTDKLRWQQSVSMRWYDFLMKEISVSFGCIVIFDTLNKLVNLYDINTTGEEVQIYLSYDNYMRDLERDNSSNDIVTRLYLTGNEEMDIIGATPSGYPYIENYSYFIENEEMSDELITAITKYEEMVAIRTETWNELIKLKQDKMIILSDKKIELYNIYGKINGLDALINSCDAIIKADKNPNEVANAERDKAKYIAERTIEKDKQEVLEQEIKILDEEIRALQSSIEEINILCKRETATNEEGHLIFNEVLLDELKEFVYCDTYVNDSFLEVEDLLKAGIRELSLKCRPKVTYSVDVVNFTKRIVDMGFRQHWNGTLSLGNIISLIDEDTEEEVLQYFVGYTLNPHESNGLKLSISDRKVREDNTRTIADYLAEARRSVKMLNRKQYILSKVKYNRINLKK